MILDSLLGLFSQDMGIDLGTANILVYIPGEGITIAEPSVVAVRRNDRRVLAVGSAAKEMLGKVPAGIEAIRPLRHGVIADFDITEKMIAYFVHAAHKRRFAVAPRMVIAVPAGITEVEKRAVFNSAERAGARKVYLITEPMAAGIGGGLPIEEPTASMVVDIGGGTAEIAVISLSNLVAAQSLRVAGDKFDEAIQDHMRRAHNLLVGEQTAEFIKIEMGSALPLPPEKEAEQFRVRGRDTLTGMPREQIVGISEVREALLGPIQIITDAIAKTLERTDPELSADLVENGMMLCGGGARLRGLDELIHQCTGLPVRVAEDPMTCVVRGTGIFLENLSKYARLMDLASS